jgi:diguanylate cyclase (GGDEF)-like protein
MLMVDVDHFKQINDAYGHSEGDEVLRVIAQALDSNVRGSDFVCRYGGEEFAVLMPQTNLEQAAGLAERIIRAVPEACRGWRATLGHDITVTIGIASFPAEAGDAAELLKVADRRLYAGKRAGRNRTVATDEPVDREASTRS